TGSHPVNRLPNPHGNLFPPPADGSTRREIIWALGKQIEVRDEQVRIVYRVNTVPFVEGPQGWVARLSQACRPLSDVWRGGGVVVVQFDKPPVWYQMGFGTRVAGKHSLYLIHVLTCA